MHPFEGVALFFDRCSINIYWMLIGQFVPAIGCGCLVLLLRRSSNALTVFVLSDMGSAWIPLGNMFGLF